MNNWQTKEREKYSKVYNLGYWPKNAEQNYHGICNYVRHYIGDDKDIKLLDIGCGPGYSLNIAKAYDIDSYGIDIVPELEPTWKCNNFNCKVACCDAIPFEDSMFDIVVCLDVMEHIPEEGIDDTLNEIKRVGKHNGLNLINISLREEEFKYGNETLHVTVKPSKWWVNKFWDFNFQPIQFALSKGASHIQIEAKNFKPQDKKTCVEYLGRKRQL